MSCRALCTEPMPRIKDVKVYNGFEFNNLPDFLTGFVDNHYYDITEDESLIDGIRCKKTKQDYVDKYSLVFNNKPNLMIEMFYVSYFFMPENINTLGHDIIYAGIKRPPYLELFQTQDKFIVINHLKPELMDDFDEGINKIRNNLEEILLTQGSIKFMDEIINKAGMNKDYAYKLIAKACEYYINNNKNN